MFGLAITSYRYIETPLRKGNWFGKRWKTIIVGGGVMITTSGCLIALGKPLKGKFYSGEEPTYTISKQIEFKGDITGRIAKNCHSSHQLEFDALAGANKITNKFIDNCLSAKSERPLVAFSGDSHSLSLFPISEVIASKSQYDVFSHSREGCIFPPQGESIKDCYEVQLSFATKMLEEIKKRNKGSVIVAISYLNSHLGYDGALRFQFKKYSNGSRNSVDNNLSDFIVASKKFASQLKDVNASLILFAPLPQHPSFTPQICSSQWFRTSINVGCQKTNKDFLKRQRKHIVQAINTLASEVNNVYIFDPFDKLCDRKHCYVKRDNTYLFSDDDHLSKEGAIMISNDLLQMINQINSQKSNYTIE